MAKKDTTAAETQTATQTQTAAQTAAQPTEAKPKMTLAQKILSVKNAVGKVYKDGTGKVGSEQKGNQKEIKYATLTNVLEKLTPALAEYGVDYVISPVWSELAVELMPQGYRFFSIHMVDVETGEVTEPIVYPFHLASNSEAIKADGSTFTYIARYLLGLVFGIQTEQDPDAQTQQQRGNQQPQQTAPTDAERRAINAYIEGVDFAKAAEEVKKLQTKYPAYDFSKMIEVASALKKTFTEFGELVSAGLWEKAEETLTAVKMANPKSKFAVWDKKLADAKAASTADANAPAPF